ncbi:sugar ABC transporter substrate-binding protein [Neobacillus piezotolerans]|uniref:Sugar ABC transporter substrate-binding protein n=1 Tax=Neobacillus piezotolerans TaxID=2259171 RepID=A0A3D8GNM3_9BACI|nr:extracellular solute-binding protein [Neobacillus piezotolerans]RDU35676.1 sugar ABC transporter substrate-binding protein [Neobacillus piezotolerans]
MLKKRFVALTSAAVLGLGLLAGCTSGKDKEASSSDSKKPVEISVWLTPQWKGVMDATEEGADFNSFFKYAGEKFSKQYKDREVKVNVEVVAGDQRDELLNVNLNGGTPPDIFFESTFAMGDYAHRGALVPLNDIVDEDAKKDIEQNFWDTVTFGKDIYFYPFSHMPGTLVYNADMFKAAGLESYIGEPTEIKTWTLEEYETILNKLKTDVPKDKYANAYPMGLYALNNQGDTWNLAYLRMFGSEFFDDESNIVLDDAKGEKAAAWLKKIYDAKLTNPGAESVSSNDVNAMFQNQQLGISFTNSVLYNNALADMNSGKAPKFDARLANIPSESGDPLTFTYVTGASVFNTGDDEKIKISKEFVKFFSSDPELVKASKNGVPVRTSVVEEFKSEKPLFEAYDKNAQYMFNFTGSVPGYGELRQVLYPELQALYTGEKTPAQAVKDYQKNGNSVLENAKANSVIFNQ